jgi:hypothetical protein
MMHCTSFQTTIAPCHCDATKATRDEDKEETKHEQLVRLFKFENEVSGMKKYCRSCDCGAVDLRAVITAQYVKRSVR